MIEVQDKFNMVDMGGIDVVESQGVAVEGLFSRLLTAIQNCRYQVLYNWKFAQIEIAPSPVELVFDGEKVSINEFLTVTEDDVVHIYSIEPEPSLIELSVTANGVYEPPSGVSGFSKVTVDVTPAIAVFTITITGGYNGGAIVEVYLEDSLLYHGVGSSPYNAAYSPSYSTFEHGGVSGQVVLPEIGSTDPRLVTIEYGDKSDSVSFTAAGPNNSYGYNTEEKILVISGFNSTLRKEYS